MNIYESITNRVVEALETVQNRGRNLGSALLLLIIQ